MSETRSQHAPYDRRNATAPIVWWLALSFTLLAASSASAQLLGPIGAQLAAGPSLEAFAVAPGVVTTPAPPLRRISEGVISRGQTLSAALREHGVSAQVIARITREFRGSFDFRRAMPGHSFRLVQDLNDELIEFRYRTSVIDGFTLYRSGDAFRVTRDEEVLEPRTSRIAGVISSNLYQAITDLGEDGQLAQDFADIFAWDIDFQRAIQPGDSFQVLYERLYRTSGGEDVYVRPGRVLAARFEGRQASHTAIYFESKPGVGGYYRPNGSSVEGMFLMAPMRHARITSGFSPARRHPILKITRPHRGIDYAAAHGAPVWSVAAGTVTHRGWAGGSGNLVKVRHDNGYVSFYAHLSRFAAGLKKGDRVEQKQVIGYVGQTGLATGPHVCFRVQKNGEYVDPARLRSPAGAPIPGELVPTFRSARDQLIAELDGRRQLASGNPFPPEVATLP